MSITEYYGHGLVQEVEKQRILSYPIEYGMLDGFSLDEYDGQFKKDVLVQDLKNAFFITTKAIYKEDEFIVWGHKIETRSLIIYTTSDRIGKKHHFTKLTGKYIKEVPIAEIEKVWEERKSSVLNTPMPEGLDLIKEIYI